MGYDKCRTCTHTGLCTFPKSRVVTECDEYADMDQAPARDWDLQQLLKLWSGKDGPPRTE